MTIAITLGILFSLFAGITEGTQIYERGAPEEEKNKLNGLWHTTQLLERIFAIAFGFSLCFVYQEYGLWYAFGGVLFLVASSFKTLYDGIINIRLGRGFFHVSQTTTSTMEKWTPWYVKMGLLLASVLALIFIPRKEQKNEDRDSGSL